MAEHRDAIVVGAGFSGLYMLLRLRKMGLNALGIEAAADVGGTWYWNRYPGARCDVESVEYSYQFSEELEQAWDWHERFATQSEILRYLNHVADRFGLRPMIRFETRVEAIHFDEATGLWTMETTGGSIEAPFCIMATGCLSVPYYPSIPGLESFRGERYHTGTWPRQAVRFEGKRVAVLGTGSSGVQIIPILAEQAAQLHVFQRTPSFTLPARNAPLSDAYRKEIKARYRAFRAENWQSFGGLKNNRRGESALEVNAEEREREFEARWQKGGTQLQAAFADLFFNAESNRFAADFVLRKIREIVRDADTVRLLSPEDPLGCRRVTVGTDYYETYNRSNVTLRSVRETPITCFTADGIRHGDEEIPVDAVVFATGFDAMTGALLDIDIRGRNGLALREKWREGPLTYLGIGIAGFPNLFTITGPGSPSVLSNMVMSIEQHVDWIARCIGHLRDRGYRRIEARDDAERAWVEAVFEIASHSLLLSCNSWYLGANIPGKPRVFSVHLDFPGYVQHCRTVADRGYEGFLLS